MAELRVRNVQAAYIAGLQLLREGGQWEETRNGPALVYPEPVMTIYERPLERVLLDPVRDANPFFHLLEGIWMLAGRRDVASIGRFNSGLKQYSDDGENYHGAYGHRWRRHFPQVRPNEGNDFLPKITMREPLDQLQRVIELLRANPADRRVVLTMWDPAEDLGREGLDVPCNTQCYFRTRDVAMGVRPGEIGGEAGKCLDMTVTVRSNDAIFGAYGANAVHFSVLLEFVAAACGFRVGRLIQLSNNLHAYRDVLERVAPWRELGPHRSEDPTAVYGMDGVMPGVITPTPLFSTEYSTRYVPALLGQVEALWNQDRGVSRDIFTTAGMQTLELARHSWESYKRGEREEALRAARDMMAPDWRRACQEWLERRYAEKK